MWWSVAWVGKGGGWAQRVLPGAPLGRREGRKAGGREKGGGKNVDLGAIWRSLQKAPAWLIPPSRTSLREYLERHPGSPDCRPMAVAGGVQDKVAVFSLCVSHIDSRAHEALLMQVSSDPCSLPSCLGDAVTALLSRGCLSRVGKLLVTCFCGCVVCRPFSAAAGPQPVDMHACSGLRPP